MLSTVLPNLLLREGHDLPHLGYVKVGLEPANPAFCRDGRFLATRGAFDGGFVLGHLVDAGEAEGVVARQEFGLVFLSVVLRQAERAL